MRILFGEFVLSIVPLSVGIAITPPRFAQIYESSINIEEITGELVLSFNEIPSARCRRHYQIIERCNSALSRCSLFFSFLPISPSSLIRRLDQATSISRYHPFVNYVYIIKRRHHVRCHCYT